MSVLSHRVRRGPGPPRERLVAAVAALFAFDGAVFGSWAARIPDVTAQVGTSHTRLGLALLCVSIGALASMQLAGALCARLGAGLDWYLNPLLSLGLQSNVELLVLSRSKAPQAGLGTDVADLANLYARDGSGVGFGVSISAAAGLHF